MAKGVNDWAKILVKSGICSVDELQDAQQMCKNTGMDLDQAVFRQGYATEAEIAKAKAKQHNIPFIDLDTAEIDLDALDNIPEQTARAKNCLAINEENGTLNVAISDPYDFELIDQLRFVTNKHVETFLAPPDQLRDLITRAYELDERGHQEEFYKEITEAAGLEAPTAEAGKDGSDEGVIDENSAPIVKLVHQIISQAIKKRASDIHVEPFEDRVRIRYRVDGVLIEETPAPRKMLNALLSRIKILSKIDIAERRKPQDGRIKLTVGTKEFDFRVSVLPTSHGQSVVMRILDKDKIKVSLKDLGFADDDYRIFQQMIRRPNGIILVTGPTGSGKTTTLYASLNELNHPDRKIITAEDPVEYYLPGINQVEVKHSIGLDFARIIRSMLRQAPNIILVGEIRDQETAEMAIQASLTGHLVFSTLHTNDAPSAITRLIDIGVPPYLVASSIIAVMGQRLVRTICPECKEPHMPTENVLKEARIPLNVAQKAKLAHGKGCSKCSKKGYLGRRAIFELMVVNSKIREMAFKGASSTDIRKVAVNNGMKTLYHDGMVKALKGSTTIEEVFRVTGKEG
ncbi:Type IV fimbrial assembly protein PilB [Planctomycetales bacterium 10988]|nr:Type IV fimbrial assembly protein PilB [Planctomycetales bacterium 10988]